MERVPIPEFPFQNSIILGLIQPDPLLTDQKDKVSPLVIEVVFIFTREF